MTNRAAPQVLAYRANDEARLIASLPLALVLGASLWTAIVTAAIRFAG